MTRKKFDPTPYIPRAIELLREGMNCTAMHEAFQAEGHDIGHKTFYRHVFRGAHDRLLAEGTRPVLKHRPRLDPDDGEPYVPISDEVFMSRILAAHEKYDMANLDWHTMRTRTSTSPARREAVMRLVCELGLVAEDTPSGFVRIRRPEHGFTRAGVPSTDPAVYIRNLSRVDLIGFRCEATASFEISREEAARRRILRATTLFPWDGSEESLRPILRALSASDGMAA